MFNSFKFNSTKYNTLTAFQKGIIVQYVGRVITLRPVNSATSLTTNQTDPITLSVKPMPVILS